MELYSELPKDQVIGLVARQLGGNFIFDAATESAHLAAGIEVAYERISHCFRHSNNKYYQRDGVPQFSPFQSGQYCIFLYYLSNALQRQGRQSLADRVYYLNKMLNGIDLYHEVEMPGIFFLEHPVGTVLGRASYGDYFSASQNVTVGNNHGAYPRIGEHVHLCPGSMVIGDCAVGDHVVLAVNACVKDADVPSSSVVFGQSPNLVIKELTAERGGALLSSFWQPR